MLIKPRLRPRILYFNEAVLSRIHTNHPKIPLIEEAISRHEAGYAGEKKLDTYLQYLPQKNYNILNDLRLSNGPFFFQLDSVIVTPKKILLLDSKNMTGKLDFNHQFDQLIQNDQMVYEDPILQAELHVRDLREWLKKYGFPPLPIEYLIFMSNKKCIINSDTDAFSHRICRGRALIPRIEQFATQYANASDMLTPEQLRKLIKTLIKKHTEPTFDIGRHYQIPRTEILPGVHCPYCKCLCMIYHGGSWLCPLCGCKSKDAHLVALRDFFLLYGPAITTEQFRAFLQLPSMNIAYKKLSLLNLPSSGSKKKRIYILSWDVFPS